MRSALYHFAGILALMVLTTGLLLVLSGSANAHPPAHGSGGAISASEMYAPAPDQGASCVSPSCESEHVGNCCHMMGAGCSSVHAICVAASDFAQVVLTSSVVVRRSTPRLDGRIPPVAQRPPAPLA